MPVESWGTTQQEGKYTWSLYQVSAPSLCQGSSHPRSTMQASPHTDVSDAFVTLHRSEDGELKVGEETTEPPLASDTLGHCERLPVSKSPTK